MAEKHITLAGLGASSGGVDANPVTTEIVRHSLNSAANQMKRALVRSAFSPVVYEVLDFAATIYDRKIRMLAQAPSLPGFMGTMSFCVEAAVANADLREGYITQAHARRHDPHALDPADVRTAAE